MVCLSCTTSVCRCTIVVMFKKSKRIYADYAAGAPILKEATAEFLRAAHYVGNPSSIHEEGRIAKKELHDARKIVAAFFNAKEDEVFFTASGTESNVLAISGVIENMAEKMGGYATVSVISSTIEHPSVRETLLMYEKKGVSVSWISPKDDGLLEPAAFKAVVNSKTSLVVFHHVNSEIGTVQPVTEIAMVCKSLGNPLIHVDACQSAPWLAVHLDTLRADTISVDSLKIGGPRGVGALIVSRGTNLKPLIKGGGQESGLRSGTENVPGIVGFAKALSLVSLERKEVTKRVSMLRDELSKSIQQALPEIVINGSMKRRVPNNLNISCPGVNADVVVTKLDVLGIAASTGTACAAGEKLSPVVSVISPGDLWRAMSAVRFTLGRDTKSSDISKIKNAYVKAIDYARLSFKE